MFDAEDVRAQLVPGAPGGDTIVVSFAARKLDADPTRFTSVFAERFLARSGTAAIHVSSSWNHWFLHEPSRAALSAIRAATAGYRRVVTLGQSLGAYAALRHSAALGAQRVVAISPRFSMLSEKVPFDPIPRPELARIDPAMDDLPGGIAPGADILILTESVGPDAKHCALIEAACGGRARLLPLPFAGHPATKHLRQTALLGEVMREMLLAPRPDVAAARRRVRAARATSVNWWTELAQHARDRGRLEVAATAALRATECHQSALPRMLSLAVKLGRRGLPPASLLPRVARMAEIAGDAPGLQKLLAAAWQAAGRPEETLAAAEAALAGNPGDASLRALRDWACREVAPVQA